MDTLCERPVGIFFDPNQCPGLTAQSEARAPFATDELGGPPTLSWRKCSLNRFGHDRYRSQRRGLWKSPRGVQGPNGSDPLNFKSLPYIHGMTDPPSYTASSFTSCNLPSGAHFRFQATLSSPQHKATRESCPFQQQHERKMPHHMNTKNVHGLD